MRPSVAYGKLFVQREIVNTFVLMYDESELLKVFIKLNMDRRKISKGYISGRAETWYKGCPKIK